MSSGDPDIVVIGSGPNGLVAAALLAREGFRVLVLEANAARPGGALRSSELTLPGFIHDLGAGFFPWIRLSPAFSALGLERHRVTLLSARLASVHPAADGSAAVIGGDSGGGTLRLLGKGGALGAAGSGRDQSAWKTQVNWFSAMKEPVLEVLLQPRPALGPLWRLGATNLIRLARIGWASSRLLSRRWFESDAARRVLPAFALQGDWGPDDRGGARLGWLLAMLAATEGNPVVQGGAQNLANGLITALEGDGGRLLLGAPVERILVSEGRAWGVRLAESGTEIRANRAVLVCSAAPHLLLDIADLPRVPGRWLRGLRQIAQESAIFKLDWALGRAVPWNCLAARECPLIQLADSVDELSRAHSQVRRGELPDRPSLVIGQPSLIDPSRAPFGQHTLSAYTRVPLQLAAGWSGQSQAFADLLEKRIEALAPGFRECLLERHIQTPDEPTPLQGMPRGIVRWLLREIGLRRPVQHLYWSMGSAVPPGPGVHGMGGYHAARRVLRDLK